MHAKFIPEPQDQWYYDILSPHLKDSPFYTTFIEPFNPPIDRSHGRYLLPFSPRENEIRNDTKYTVWDKRVFLNEEKTDWIFYQVRLYYIRCLWERALIFVWLGLGGQGGCEEKESPSRYYILPWNK